MPQLAWPNPKFTDELRHYRHHLNFSGEGLSEIQIHAPASGFEWLIEGLESVRSRVGLELKWVLSQETTLFIKNRGDGDSKALIAHPEEKEWVGSLSLNEKDFNSLLQSLKGIQTSSAFDLKTLFRLGRASNLNIKFFLVLPVSIESGELPRRQ